MVIGYFEHDEDCNCGCSGKELRYALHKLKEEFYIIEASETTLLNEVLAKECDEPDIITFTNEELEYRIFYGAFMPQRFTVNKDDVSLVNSFTDMYHGYFDFEKYTFNRIEIEAIEYISRIHEYKFAVAVLAKVPPELPEDEWITAIPMTKDLKAIDHIYNRRAVFGLKETEKNLDGIAEDFSNWTDYIDRQRAVNVAEAVL